MNIGILGTGVVGETIATALTEKGYNVRMGSRSASNEKAAAWVKRSNKHATQGDFNDAASFGDIVFVCLNGAYALDAIKTIDAESVDRKIVIDLTNPLDFTHGMPPRLLEGFGNANSLGEEIQRALPHAYVVKTLNTVTAKLMVQPKQVNGGDHNLFICGNDGDAKNKVKHFLVDVFGWRPDALLDLGGIQSARLTESYVPFWVGMMQTLGTSLFNIRLVK